MSERCATRTTSWARAGLIDGDRGRELARALQQTAFEVPTAGFGRHHHRVDEHGEQVAPGRQVGPQVRTLVRAHPFELHQRSVHGGLDERREPLGGASAIGQPFADAQRLRQPQEIAGPERAVDHALLARQLERGRQGLHERGIQLDLRRRCLSELQGHVHLDPAARQARLHQPADTRLQVRDRGRQAELQVEKTVIHGSHGHADRSRRILSGERGKPRHALDHGVIRGSAGSIRDMRDSGRSSTSSQLVQPRVGAIGSLNELVVAPHFHDVAPLEHDDRIGATNGREPMRDHKRRAIQQERGERVLHQALRFRVERRGRFVQDQDRRVLEQGAGDRQPLALPAQRAAARARRSWCGSRPGARR